MKLLLLLLIVSMFEIQGQTPKRPGKTIRAQLSQEKSVATPAGWRLPKQSDLKERWSEKYWIDECNKEKEAAKKAATDAIEQIGDVPPTVGARTEPYDKDDGCWKPDFPVHMASGDYNGDGLEDEARILISTTKRGLIGIFAFMKGKNTAVNMVRITTIPDAHLQNHFIGTVNPGEKIDTACGKGYWDCGPAEPKSITLRREAISFGLFESWASVAYWDSRRNKFKVVAISD